MKTLTVVAIGILLTVTVMTASLALHEPGHVEEWLIDKVEASWLVVRRTEDSRPTKVFLDPDLSPDDLKILSGRKVKVEIKDKLSVREYLAIPFERPRLVATKITFRDSDGMSGKVAEGAKLDVTISTKGFSRPVRDPGAQLFHGK